MNKFEISFLALSHSGGMSFKSESPLQELLDDFMELFVKEGDIDVANKKVNIKSLQQNTRELRESIDVFVDKYKGVNVKIFQLRSFFQKLDDGEFFFLLPDLDIDLAKRMQLHNYLESLRINKDFNIIQKQFEELFTDLTSAYNIVSYDERTTRAIGEQDKSKRVCRFCKNNRSNVVFKNIAHAISESLGNKKIILNEECDECNALFGSAKGIEGSLIAYLKLYSNIFGVKGKNGIPKMKGKNFELSNEGSIELKTYSDEAIEDKENFKERSFRLETFDKIILQDIYKTICKYALSVIGNELIGEFDETISWINNAAAEIELPSVGILSSPSMLKIHPSITVFTRKIDDESLPFAVAEFHHTFLTFVFIIPFAKPDSKNFISQSEYDRFWSFFKQYSGVKGWEFRNFSDSERRNFVINMNFEIKDGGDEAK